MISAFYLIPEPLMGFYDRFLYSVEVTLFVLAAMGLQSITANSSVLTSSVIVALLVLSHIGVSLYSPRAKESFTSSASPVESYRMIAKELEQIPGHQQIELAFADAGIIPYYSDVRHLDLVGLNDNHIAKQKQFDDVFEMVSREKPDIILIPVSHSTTAQDSCRNIYIGGHGIIGNHYLEMIRDPRFAGFRPLATFPSPVYDLVLLLNGSSAYVEPITKTLGLEMTNHPAIIQPPPRCLN